MALDKKLFDDAQTAYAVQFQNHHDEHAAAAGSLAGVGAVGTNGQMVNAYAGRVRTANTVDALFDVLFELESRAASTYLLACGTYVQPRAAGFAGSCALDRGAARHRARLGGELADRDLHPRLRVDRRSVPARRVPGAGMSDMGMGRDELRRQMRDAEAEHLESMGGFREAIKRFAGGDSVVQPTRAARRRWRASWPRCLAVCADHTAKPQVPEGGAQTPTTVTIAPPPVNDVTLLRTASSIEILAVQTYQKGIDSGLLTTPALLDAAKLFRDQHHDHNDLFTAATTEAGGEPYTKPNPYIQLKVVDTILPSVKKEVDLVNLALELEDTAGGSYQVWVPLFSTPELRQTIQSVGATERRHSIILTGVLPDEELFPSPFGNVTLAVGPASLRLSARSPRRPAGRLGASAR